MLEETHSKILISINNASFNLLQISNLNIVQGEKYFVTGSSSSGKSTLIRLLFGDLNPQKGQVFISKKKYIEFLYLSVLSFLKQPPVMIIYLFLMI